MIKRLWSDSAELWCRIMHPDPMWPSHGRYRCPTCLREYPVPWANSARTMPGKTPGVTQCAAPSTAIKGSMAQPAHSW